MWRAWDVSRWSRRRLGAAEGFEPVVGFSEVFGGFDGAPEGGALESGHAALFSEFGEGGCFVVAFCGEALEDGGVDKVDAGVDPVGQRGFLGEAVYPAGVVDANDAIGADQLG